MEEKVFKKLVMKDKEVLIKYDINSQNPRHCFDNISTMICFHNRYKLGDDNDLSSSMFYDWIELEDFIWKKYNPIVVKPLYLYDHSGLTISTTPFSSYWDSGQIGFIFIKRQDVLMYYSNWQRISQKRKKKLIKSLKEEVKIYDDYLRGRIFGYEIKKNNRTIDSCWGFYGTNFKTNGLVEHAQSFVPRIREKL